MTAGANRVARSRRFKQVDVFTRVPFLGNPVAVVLDAQDIDTEQMQAIARWTNLSETTFVMPATRPDADYRLRIFTPQAELPFAGHPTLGSAHAVLEAGIASPRDGTLRQECGMGVIALQIQDGPAAARKDGARLWLRGPQATIRALDAAHQDALARALAARVVHDPAPHIVDVGPVWLVVALADTVALGSLAPDMAALTALSGALAITGIVAFAPSGEAGTAIHVRAFAPLHGVPEDPVCGSGNLSVGAFIAHTGQVERYGRSYRARQGMQVGRDGRIAVRIEDDGATIWLGGDAVTCIDGSLCA